MKTNFFNNFTKYFTKRNIVVFLCALEMIIMSLMIASLRNKNVEEFTVGIDGLHNEILALMVEDDKGRYQQFASTEFPKQSEYRYNSDKSSCVDNDGNLLKNSITYDLNTHKVTVLVRESAYCYLYFDKIIYLQDYLVNNNDKFGMWQSELEEDGYRFTGSGDAQATTSPKNFICFGTSDKNECVNNPNNYMYRIIGVFPDDAGNNYVKLIKYASLSNTMPMNPDFSNINWGQNNLYDSLNAGGFLTNTTYVPDDTWNSRIINWQWTAVNTLTTKSGGPNYNAITTAQMYLHEMNRRNKTSIVGEWTNVNGKIGLMYASDYMMSLGAVALSYVGNNSSVLKTGWMHISNNISLASSVYEWTISHDGWDDMDIDYKIWTINTNGSVASALHLNSSLIRPVFYLTEYNERLSGSGTINDPIIIGGLDVKPPNVQATINNDTITAIFTKGDNELYGYCVNNLPNSDGCKWSPLTGTTITEKVSNKGTYYVHVIDTAGYIAHSKGLEFAGIQLPKLTDELIAKGDMWESGLDGDGYRYAGTTPDNYVCFGTTNRTTCSGNPNTYMYRVIGVFKDSFGVNHAKLIKYATLPDITGWHGDATDTKWEKTDLYADMNGAKFLTNATYVPDTSWSDKITDWRWTTVNSLTSGSGGPDYYNGLSPSNIYLHELNRSGKTSTIGTWATENGKIGLIYASDFALSLGETAKKLTSGTYKNRNTLKTGWIFLKNNIDTTNDGYEWTLSRYGSSPSATWYINSLGHIDWQYVGTLNAIRPVFYLNNDVGLIGGTGTITDPYIITE